MRFVLVGISLCLAWLAAWRCLSSEQSAAAEQEQQLSSKQGSRQWQERLNMVLAPLHWSSLLDMFTGRYIYKYCTAGHAPVMMAGKAG